ncbi:MULTISPECIES: hypothetical protein [unclassified Streptomyces]|uniref:SCO4225 family membrane protein n=1 Tax=unclassified Streptomyces TaxID=2593676 RepID=UPI000C27A605|nr:hypothetical protein [Streptomyces sp. CB01373]PJM94788.1 hypothetical protein CG719_15600 [Streptomyces sp. CB01373]
MSEGLLVTATLNTRCALNDATSDWTTRAYVGSVAVLGILASAEGLGLVDTDSTARFLAVILCMPWTLLVAAVVSLNDGFNWLLGYNFFADSPAWLFEPLWTVFWTAAALANARTIAALSRSASRRPGVSPFLVPMSLLAFVSLIALLWRL